MSNNIATKLQAILSAKGDIKDAIEGKGVTVGNASLDQYASKIEAIQGGDTDGLNGFLSVESKTIPTSASATTNITYNKNCGILDENYKKWDTLAWHQRWVDNGYSATGLSKPIGIWMKAFGLDIVYLWPLSNSTEYYEVSGTNSIPANLFTHFMYNQNPINVATRAGGLPVDRTVWPANQSGMISHGTAGKYKSASWRSKDNGDGLDMECDNTLETFTIPSRDIDGGLVFMKDNNEDYIESYYQQNEFCRALFAICSGVAVPTGTQDGVTTTVEILNSSGQQAAVNEDMYFYINGTNTGLLAKYNLNSIPNTGANQTTGTCTQAVADAIYAKQKENGINMNDTGINSATRPVLSDGMKGAEAIAVDGYWYIKTPYISSPSSTNFLVGNNCSDTRTVYLCKNRGVSMPTERMLYPYYLNIKTHISSLLYILRTIEGLGSIVPELPSNYIWSAIRYNAQYCIYVSSALGYISSNTTNNRFMVMPCPLSSTQFTT